MFSIPEKKNRPERQSKVIGRVYLQGRVVARNSEEAVEKVHEALERQGYEVERLTMFPCAVQPYEQRWIEYVVEVREIQEAL